MNIHQFVRLQCRCSQILQKNWIHVNLKFKIQKRGQNAHFYPSCLTLNLQQTVKLPSAFVYETAKSSKRYQTQQSFGQSTATAQSLNNKFFLISVSIDRIPTWTLKLLQHRCKTYKAIELMYTERCYSIWKSTKLYATVSLALDYHMRANSRTTKP